MKNKNLIGLPLLLLLVSCGPSVEVDDSLRKGETTLNIISCNDFHGVAEGGYYPGIEKWGAEIKYFYDLDKENALLLSAGDMFQGSGVSSLTNGKVIIDAMNYLKFDAMAIGNHEFDWGVDVLKSAHDGIENNFSFDENKEANPEASFPYLACNIYYNNGTEDESDDTFCDFADKFKIVTRGGLRIGLIGYIGTDQLRSIVSTIGGQFSFHEPVEEIKKVVKDLRQKEKCDIVIAIGHDGHDSSSSYNQTNSDLANLTGNYKIDLILNAHTHSSYVDNLGNNVYAIQSGQYGQKIGYTSITYNFSKKSVTGVTCENIDVESNSSLTNERLASIYVEHIDSVEKILNEKIGYISSKIYSSARDQIGGWTADCIAHMTNSDYGSVNSGGIRASGFPLNAGEFTYNDLIGIMPFDNCIVTCTMKGSDVSKVLRNSALCYDFELQNNPSISYAAKYKMAFDEYSFGKYIEPRYFDIEDIVYTSYLVRDAMKKEIKHQFDLGLNFDYSLPASF